MLRGRASQNATTTNGPQEILMPPLQSPPSDRPFLEMVEEIFPEGAPLKKSRNDAAVVTNVSAVRANESKNNCSTLL